VRRQRFGSTLSFRGTITPAAIVLLTACSLGQAQSIPTPSPPPGFQTASVANGRFSVFYGVDAVAYAMSVQRDLSHIVETSLEHVDHLLPGPRATVIIQVCDAPIAETGTCGLTSGTGLVSEVGFAATTAINAQEALDIWLPRTLAHEVHQEVRSQSSTGRRNLLGDLVLEGTADVFDNQAFPGQFNPWDMAVTPAQEHALWLKARLMLTSVGLYKDWMFGNSSMGIPHWAGFTIGYHIASAYLSRHPETTTNTLATLQATSILAGSDYSP
jgi:uncharacterized protein YjaZ